jgi:hypothetical protein
VTGRWFSPVSSTNKTDRHDITEILLKVALNTIKPKMAHYEYHLSQVEAEFVDDSSAVFCGFIQQEL